MSSKNETRYDHSQFHRLLLILTKAEKRKFRKWIIYETSEKKAARLLLVYDQAIHLSKEGGAIKKIDLMKPVFGDSVRNWTNSSDKIYRNILHDLYIFLKNFIAWEKLRHQKIALNRLVQDELLIRKAYDLAVIENNKSNEIINKSKIKNTAYFKDQHDVIQIRNYLRIILRKVKQKNNVSTLIGSERMVFLSQILLSYCSAINHQKVYSVEHKLPFLPYVLEYLKNSDDLKTPYIGFFYNMYISYSKDSQSHYSQAKTICIQNKEQFSKVDLRQMINLLISFSNTPERREIPFYLTQRLDLIKVGLKEKIWTDGIHFSAPIFTLIIKTFVTDEQTDWCSNFIEEYRAVLPKKLMEETCNYSLALTKFENGQLEEAEFHYNQLKSSIDHFHYLRYQTLAIKITYSKKENKYTEKILNLKIEAFRKYLTRNNKMSEANKVYFQNFITAFVKLYRFQTNELIDKKKSQDQLLKLNDWISKNYQIAERAWLLKSLDKLLKTK